MRPTQTQSLPTWAPTSARAVSAAPPTCQAAAATDDDPLYLSGEETDCDSERSSGTLSREDQQVMAKFIQLERARARKRAPDATAHPDVVRARPVLIPLQSRQYVATSTKRWLWDDDDEADDDECSGCHERGARGFGPVAPVADGVAMAARDRSTSDLLFDFEL
ncbi:unnamed protein product [Hyaloperonospora brassicae]|uniref:Uncharacterized protein n=1 Tax=Hyaloperonospora brassicae TaxID=162125 RepID=A0AAV0T9T4_HYABA|nr:unnamed protein product [Hyaloperonospora brassicae]